MAIEEKENLGDLLKFEIDKNYCREVVTVAAGQNLKLGTIVGIVAATGAAKSVYLPTGDEDEVLDGSEIAVGVLLENADATSGAKKSLMIARGAIVAENTIVFPEGATDAQKKKIVGDLEARGVVIRKAVYGENIMINPFESSAFDMTSLTASINLLPIVMLG
jgi:hypothetical protein